METSPLAGPNNATVRVGVLPMLRRGEMAVRLTVLRQSEAPSPEGGLVDSRGYIIILRGFGLRRGAVAVAEGLLVPRELARLVAGTPVLEVGRVPSRDRGGTVTGRSPSGWRSCSRR